MIKFEGNKIEKIYLGESKIKKIYLGSDLIYRYIPERYRIVSGIKNSSSTKVPTSIKLDSTNWEIETVFTATSGTLGSFYYLQSRATSSAGIYGISGSTSTGGISIGCGGVGAATGQNIFRAFGNKYYIKGGLNDTTVSIYIKNITTAQEENRSNQLTSNYINPTIPLTLFGGWNTNNLNSGYICHYLKIKKNGEIVLEYIPAIDTQRSNKAGFYNTVNNTFVTESQGGLTAV